VTSRLPRPTTATPTKADCALPSHTPHTHSTDPVPQMQKYIVSNYTHPDVGELGMGQG